MQLVRPEQSLETARFLLEPIGPAHAAKLFDSLQAPDLYRHIPLDVPESVTSLEQRFSIWSRRRSEDGEELWLNWAIRLRHMDTYVGTLQATVKRDGSALIAYATFPTHWRNGIAQECCRRMIRHLFEDYQLRSISARVDTQNEASWRLLESLGFTRIGLMKDADEFKGRISDEYLYELKAARGERTFAKGTDPSTSSG